MDTRLPALRLGLARHARVRVERGEASAQHRGQKRRARGRERRAVARGHDRGKEWQGSQRGVGWVCEGVGGDVPHLIVGSGSAGRNEPSIVYFSDNEEANRRRSMNQLSGAIGHGNSGRCIYTTETADTPIISMYRHYRTDKKQVAGNRK